VNGPHAASGSDAYLSLPLPSDSSSSSSDGLFSDSDDDTVEDTPPTKAFNYYGQVITNYVIDQVYLNEDFEPRAEVSFRVQDNTPCGGAIVPFQDFNPLGKEEFKSIVPIAPPGGGKVEAIDNDGCLLWTVLEILDYDRRNDKVLVSWAGTWAPCREWVDRLALSPPHGGTEYTVQDVENELGYRGSNSDTSSTINHRRGVPHRSTNM
jgi:hypothetical protein